MLPYVAETVKMSLSPKDPCLVLGAPAPQLFSCVVCHIRACFHVFSVILAVFSSASASLDLIPQF